MNWKAGLLALLAVTALTGCGGGSGDSAIGVPTAQASDEVIVRERDMNGNITFENNSRLMGYYSNVYHDDLSRNKEQIKAIAEDVFKQVDFLRVDALDPTLDPKYNPQTTTGSTTGTGAGEQDDPIRVNPDGTLVRQRVYTHIVMGNKTTHQEIAVIIRGIYIWANEKGAWRIISADHGTIDSIRGFLAGETDAIVGIPEVTQY